MQRLHQPDQPLQALVHVDAPSIARPTARPGQVTLDHPVHRVDLATHLHPVNFRRTRVGVEQRQRLLQCMAEVSRIAPRPRHDPCIALQHLVDLGRQRVQVGTIAAAGTIGLAGMDALQRIMQTTQRAQPQPDLHIHASHHRQRQTTQHHHQDAVDAGHVLATGLGRAVDIQPVRMARDVEVACQPIQQLVTRPTQGQQLDRTRHRPGHGHIQAAVPQRPGAIHGAFGVQLPVPAREDEAELVADQPVVEAHPSVGVHHQTRHDAVGPFIE